MRTIPYDNQQNRCSLTPGRAARRRTKGSKTDDEPLMFHCPTRRRYKSGSLPMNGMVFRHSPVVLDETRILSFSRPLCIAEGSLVDLGMWSVDYQDPHPGSGERAYAFTAFAAHSCRLTVFSVVK